MQSTLSKNWWALALRGLVAVLFGLVVVFSPGSSLIVLVLAFGAYAMVDGVLSLIAGIRGTAGPQWLLIVEGTVGVLAGVVAFAWPGVTALIVLYIVAFRAILGGIVGVVAAIALRREMEGEWFLVLVGALSIFFGVLLAVLPVAGILSLVWLVGMYAVVVGIALLALASRVRRGAVVRPSRVS